MEWYNDHVGGLLHNRYFGSLFRLLFYPHIIEILVHQCQQKY